MDELSVLWTGDILTTVPVRFCFLAVDGYFFGQVARLQLIGVDSLSVPDEILEKLVGVLVLHDQASSVDYFARVLDQSSALRREFVDIDGRMLSDISQCLVDLNIGGEFSFAKSVNNAIKTNLQILL